MSTVPDLMDIFDNFLEVNIVSDKQKYTQAITLHVISLKDLG